MGRIFELTNRVTACAMGSKNTLKINEGHVFVHVVQGVFVDGF